MKAIDIIIGVGWIVFWVYWLAMATTAKAGQSRWTRFAGVRVGLIIVIAPAAPSTAAGARRKRYRSAIGYVLTFPECHRPRGDGPRECGRSAVGYVLACPECIDRAGLAAANGLRGPQRPLQRASWAPVPVSA
jgi:hypothetical protein